MNYTFNANVNDQDYLYFSEFLGTRSAYGKKQTKRTKLLLLAIGLIGWLFCVSYITLFLVRSEINIASLTVAVILYAFSTIIFGAIITVRLAFYNALYRSRIKRILKAQRKQGKVCYSSSYTLEFHEDSFFKITEDSTTEMKYSIVERVSIIENKFVCFHINSLSACLLPVSCFESKEQYDEFLAFIKTKCEKIDIYKK